MKNEDGLCNLMYLFESQKLNDFDFGCRRFQELLQKQRNWVNNYNRTVLMWLCLINSQLLNHDWTVEFVQRLGGKVSKNGYTALMWLFDGNPENTDFNSNAFKLLWEKEKNINIKELKELMRKIKYLKYKLFTAVLEAIEYYI